MGLRSTSGVKREYLDVLTGIFEFMLVCRLSKRDIRSIATSALDRAHRAPNGKRSDQGYLSTAALVLDAWHRDRRYLTARGEARAVRLLGPAPSVEALITAEKGKYQRGALARRLTLDGLIVSSGRGLYKPASSIALLSAFDSVAVQHVARSVAMLLETIRRNLEFPRASQRFIERIAEVPDLPIEDVPAFRRFTHLQGRTFLRTVNDWLETRRARSLAAASGRSVRAGIHVHSYVGMTPR